MAIKNYTSGVNVERSLMLIEKLLIDVGATNISKSINEQKEIDGIIFMIVVEGRSMLFKLKARTDEVFKILWRDVSPRSAAKVETKDKIREQALRTAWKLLFDRIQMDATDIKLGQMELLEVFLTRAYDMQNNLTFFEKLKGDGFKLLQAKNSQTK